MFAHKDEIGRIETYNGAQICFFQCFRLKRFERILRDDGIHLAFADLKNQISPCLRRFEQR